MRSSSLPYVLLQNSQHGTVIRLAGRGAGKRHFGGTWSFVVASLSPQYIQIVSIESLQLMLNYAAILIAYTAVNGQLVSSPQPTVGGTKLGLPVGT